MLDPVTPPWAARLIRMGRRRTMVLLTAFSVVASLLLVAIFTVIFDAQPEDLPEYYIPAVVVPLIVAPTVIRLLLNLVFALDAAHAQAARQQRELARMHQLDLVGRLASGLAHELNNLLTVVRASVASLGGAGANDDLAAIDGAAERGARLTRRLLAMSRAEEIRRTRQPLSAVLEGIQGVLPRLLPPSVHLVLPPTVPAVSLDLDADAIQQALLNLVLNARDALDGGGTIAIAVQSESVNEQPWLVLTVHDTGRGMAPELLARATEPFVTTKAAHQGTGLGLSIVRRTMEQHGGRLTLTSHEGTGTSAALWFPVPAPLAPDRTTTPVIAGHEINAIRLATPAAANPDPAHEGRVLLVDDEAEVRQVTARVLERAGYRVASVPNAPAAQQWLTEHAPVDVIVTDVMMPGTTGLELLHQMRADGNATPVLLVSGFSVERVEEIAAADPAVRFLAKPWTPAVLTSAVAALALDGQRASRASGATGNPLL